MRRRWVIFAVLVVVVVLAALSSLAVGAVRSTFPQVSGRVDLSVLTRPVEVLRDAYGVPQIYAENADDLFAAEGYVHAQDRFFEMDVRRHLSAGRLGELFGAGQVDTDAYVRTLGWRRTAAAELPLVSSATRRYLDAYASGVNAYLSSHKPGQLSLEYRVLSLGDLDYVPEAWTAVDSLSWLKAMAWSLDGNRREETERALVTGKLGSAAAAELFPKADAASAIVRRGAVRNGRFDPTATPNSARVVPTGLPAEAWRSAAPAFRAASGVDTIPEPLGPDLLGPGAIGLDPVGTRGAAGDTGSNSWVLSGSRTTTGKPLLGNDPHLATSMPSVFEQVGLHCRTVDARCPFDVTGFSFSGVPGVMIGHNAKIAWGLTTSYVDTQDLFLERLRGDETRVAGGWQPMEVREEQIKVAGEEHPRTLRIRVSRHGPLLSDVDSQLREVGAPTARAPETYGVALAWAALQPGRTMDGLLALNAAGSFDQFRAAARLVASPSQNLVYADTAGNIGYQLPGAIPVRDRGDGLAPRPGWDLTYDWRGNIPFGELPWVKNPPSGYIVTANQPVLATPYPLVLTNNTSHGWRSQRLNELIANYGRISSEQAETFFYDTTSIAAADIVPVLLRVKLTDPWIAEGQRTLVGWDYRTDADSAAAAYFNIVVYDILKRTFRDELPRELWPADLDRYQAVIVELLKRPKDPWWDDATTPQVETRDDILATAMGDARREATSLMSRDAAGWQWGRIHRVTLRSQTLGSSGIGVMERLFNRGDYPVGGGAGVVDALAYDPNRGYRVTSGPAMRMLVDLSNLDTSRWINQSGTSGHAFASTYDDQLPLWATNRMLPMVSSRAAVDAATTERLDLVPTG